MPKASYQQANFLGGEWSPLFQGRVDNPRYKTAMNVSSNGYPVEEGAWVKRSGFKFIAPTSDGLAARLFPFSVNEDTPFNVELSSGILRIFAGDSPVVDSTANIISISSGSPCQIVVDSGGAAWGTADTIVVNATAGTPGYAFGSILNMTMTLTKVANQVYTLTDMATGNPVDGSQINLAQGGSLTASRIFRVATVYGGNDWYNVKTTMVGTTMFFWHADHPPQLLTLVGGVPNGINSVFTFTQPQFMDGPYLTSIAGEELAWPGTPTSTMTLTLVNGFGPNQSVPTANDVGRSIRLLSEPAQWDVSTHYTSVGTQVTFSPAYGVVPTAYYSLIASTPGAGYDPNLNPAYWALDPELPVWAWAVITSVAAGGASFDVQFWRGMSYNSAANISAFQVGLFGDPYYGQPTCGAYHEGRLWAFGSNIISGSTTTDPTGLTWSPTLVDETVTDASGISYILEAGDDSSSNILWAISNQQGMVLGTNGGEWLVQASALNDPITPTSIQAHRVTKYRCSYVRPVQTPLSIVFVQRFQRKIMEFLQDVFTGRYVAPNLTTTAKHLTSKGIEEVVYQEELTPIIWARDLNGALLGVTYRRQSSFPSEEPVFTGWHRHFHGEGNRVFNSLAMAPSGGQDGSSSLVDYLYAVTSDVSIAGTYRIERMVKMFDVEDDELSAFFLDGGVVPCGMLDVGSGVQIYGMYAHAGLTVTVILGGVNMGTFAVNSDGNITVPYTSTVTAAYLESLDGQDFGEAFTYYSTTSGGGLVPVTPLIAPFPGSFTKEGGGTGNNLGLIVNYGAGQACSIAGTIGSSTTFKITSYAYVATGTVPASQGTVNADVSISGPTQIAGFCYSYDGNIMVQLASDQVSAVQKYSPTLSPLATIGQTTDFPTAADDNVFLSQGFVSFYAGANMVFTMGNSATTDPGVPQVINTDTMTTLGTFGGGVEFANAATTCYCSQGYSSSDPAPSYNTADGLVFVMEYTSSILTTYKLVLVTPTAYAWAAGVSAWSSSTTYAIGNQVLYGGALYTSRINSNLNNAPTGATSADWTLVVNPGLNIITVGTIGPTAIDATWTHLTVSSVGYDRTDSNLIILVSTTDAVTNQYYLAKVNSATGAILWKTAFPWANFISNLATSRIGNGLVGVISDYNLWVSYFNSLTGAYLTAMEWSASGIITSTTGQAAVDAISGLTILQMTYAEGNTGAPAPWPGGSTGFTSWAVTTSDYATLATVYSTTVPCVVGFDYSGTTQGQLLRPGSSQESGAANGPPQGKKRRTNQYAALFQNTQGVSIGTDFSHLNPVNFAYPDGSAYPVTTLFSGTVWDTLSDDFSYDSMLAWQSTGPYPLTIVSISGFIETQDY